MELRRYLAILRHRLPLVAAILVAALAAGYLITPRTSTYTAAATIYVGDKSPTPALTAGGVPYDRSLGLDRLINTWTQQIPTPAVASAALAQARVNRSVGVVTAETSAKQIYNTNLLVVSVTDPDPPTAQVLANSMANAFIGQLEQIATGNDLQQYLSVSEPASLPTAPNSRGLTQNMMIAGILGLVVALGLVSLLEYLDITIRDPQHVEDRLNLPVLGVIPAMGSQLPAPASPRVRRGTRLRRGSSVRGSDREPTWSTNRG